MNKAESGLSHFDKRAKAAYAIGGVPSGVIIVGLSMFVLFFYNNVLGVPAELVGLALAIALIFDAVSDPVVGYMSDRFKSRIGRRHPFMYFSILPASLLLYALWHPPYQALDSYGLFLYLLCVTIPLRLMLTFFDVPGNALVPELTKDYRERTEVATYRVAVTWIMIAVMAMLLYGYWLQPTKEFPDGLLNPAGYNSMGLFGACLVLLTMLICSVGLHRFIPRLPSPTRVAPWHPVVMLRDIFHTLCDPKLLPVLIAGFWLTTGFTTYGALYTYMFSYYWELSSAQLSMAVTGWALGAFLGLTLPFTVLGRIEKKTACLVSLVGIIFSTCTPVLLFEIGLFPEKGSTLSFSILWCFMVLDQLVYIGVLALIQSMFSDVVEHRHLSVGHREEGTIYAGFTLVQKFSSALSVFLVGMVLSFIEFPAGESAGSVPADVVRRLAIAWVVGNAFFYFLCLVTIRRYSISRADHLDNVKKTQEASEILSTNAS